MKEYFDVIVYFALGVAWLGYQLLFLNSDEERKEIFHSFLACAWQWRFIASFMCLFFWWGFCIAYLGNRMVQIKRGTR